MNPAGPLRVACVGAGYFSGFHIDSWRRMEGAEPVAICDLDLSRAEATGLTAYRDLAQMLAAEGADILDVILPPDAQADAIGKASAHNVKTVICQKPFCMSPEEARAVTKAAAAAGTTLIIHENFRFQPWYRAIRQALDSGRIGTVHQITYRLRPGDGQGPGAYLDRQPYFQKMERFLVRETAVHWIDTFRYLLGDPVAVYADLRRINPAIAGEDAGYVLFDCPGGARALFDGNRHLDHASDNPRRTLGEALVEGSEGTLTLTGDGAVTLRRFGEVEGEQILGPDRWDGFGGDCVHALQSHVVAHLRDGHPLENTAEEYLAVVEAEAAIYRSAREGRKLSLGAA